MEKRKFKLINGTPGTWEMWRDEIVPVGKRLQFLLCGSYSLSGFGDAYEGGRETLRFVTDKGKHLVEGQLYFPADLAVRLVRIAALGWRAATGSAETFDECCPHEPTLEQRSVLLFGNDYKVRGLPILGKAGFVFERKGHSRLYVTREAMAWLTRVASMGWAAAILPESQFESDFQEDGRRTTRRGELDGIHGDISTINGRLDGQGTEIRGLQAALCGVVERETRRWAYRDQWSVPNMFLPDSPRSQRTLGAKAYQQYPFNHIAFEDTRKYVVEKGNTGGSY